jgi:DNA primase
MIPAKTVQDIIEATRIEDVVGEFVTLRRRGINLLGLCPFHGEKTPSFNVNPTRNIFKCFGCGKAGDAITFLREHESMSFDDAIRWLGRKYNIEIQEVERTPQQMAEVQLADSLFIVNDFAAKHFSDELFNTDEGKSVALSYFRQRGLREETIRKFGLGYAPNQRDLLLQKARLHGHSLDLLKQTGLVSQDATRDFFRGRVMFTIHNLSGKVAAFAGRTMSTEKTVPKYINSPETAVYIKNKTLYGAFQAKNAIRKADECILVEGYMDVISLAQAGIENVVASSGTSLTEGQLQLIKRNTANLTILYDGDAAGVKAALRGLDLALEQDLNVRIALLPDGHDPDSYVQEKGADELRAFIADNSKDFILFKTGLLLEETKGDPIKRAGLIKDIVSSIAKIPDPIKRSVYLRECAALLQVDEAALMTETNRIITGNIKKTVEKEAKSGGAASDSWNYQEPFPDYPMGDPEYNAPPTDSPSNKNKGNFKSTEYQEREIIEILIEFGDQILPEGVSVAKYILTDIEDSLEFFETPMFSRIAKECYQLLLNGEEISSKHFIYHPDQDIKDFAITLLTKDEGMSHNWVEKLGLPLQNQPPRASNFAAQTYYGIDFFKINKLSALLNDLKKLIQESFVNNDNEKLEHYLKVQMKVKKSLDELAKKRNITILPK